jgi:cytosine/adenosine deaminase-related metal-dependent hydrolase
MEKDHIYSGYVFQGKELNLIPAQVIVKGGVISAIEEVSKAPNIWILPAFFNAHTHLADTIAMDIPYKGSIVDIVSPPNGLKHRILAGVSDTDLITGMRSMN